jgi:hypothetical protein
LATFAATTVVGLRLGFRAEDTTLISWCASNGRPI